MISPWTIYQEQKQPSPNAPQSKKSKQDSIKTNKKQHKHLENKSLTLPQTQSHLTNHDTQLGSIQDQDPLQTSYQNHLQGEFQKRLDINSLQQNKIQQLHQETGSQNQHQIDEAEQLFRGLDHPELITEEARSKNFLRNVLSDSLAGYLDNSKLLQFCKNQANSDLIKSQPQSPKKRRSITNLMRIEAQKQSLMQQFNLLVVLKYIKSTLRIEQAIEREVDNDIESVLQKVNPQFLRRISPQELLLEKLLRNEQQKMLKNKQSKSMSKESLKKESHINQEHKGQKLSKEISPKKLKKHKELSKSQIMQTLQQDIEKSSIIKYINPSDSPYLQVEGSNKKAEKDHINTSLKLKDELKATQININNQKLAQKLIYISKKSVSSRPNDGQLQCDINGIELKSQMNQRENPEIEIGQKLNKNEQKQNIEKLIKQHMALRHSRKSNSQQKQPQNDKIELQIRKLQGKNYIISQIPASIPQQSNLISPKLKKSRTINLINQYPPLKQDSKKHSKLSLQSPLMPPQFELPPISHRTLDSDQKGKSSSSKLLELITNNILQQKYKSHKRNSTQKSSSNLIDQLFIKDKEKKQMMMRRNHSVNIKNTKEILREVNKKQFFNIDQQIMELKETQRYLNLRDKHGQASETQPNQSVNSRPIEGTNSMKKDFLEKDSMIQDYNFMRKRPNKLTAFETELIGLISSGNDMMNTQNCANQMKIQKGKTQMNTSGLKFSDHQIVHGMNLITKG